MAVAGANITLDNIFSGLRYVVNATLYSGILSSTSGLSDLTLTTLSSVLTNGLNTGVAGVTSFAMASSAAVFAILVTMVALYAFDVMARSNSFATPTSRLSAEPDEGNFLPDLQSVLFYFWYV